MLHKDKTVGNEVTLKIEDINKAIKMNEKQL